MPRKDYWHSGRLKSDRRFRKRDHRRVPDSMQKCEWCGGGRGYGPTTPEVPGGRRCGGIGTIVKGHEDTGTRGVERVCLERRNAATKARQERRNKSVTPHAGYKYDDWWWWCSCKARNIDIVGV